MNTFSKVVATSNFVACDVEAFQFKANQQMQNSDSDLDKTQNYDLKLGKTYQVMQRDLPTEIDQVKQEISKLWDTVTKDRTTMSICDHIGKTITEWNKISKFCHHKWKKDSMLAITRLENEIKSLKDEGSISETLPLFKAKEDDADLDASIWHAKVSVRELRSIIDEMKKSALVDAILNRFGYKVYSEEVLEAMSEEELDSLLKELKSIEQRIKEKHKSTLVDSIMKTLEDREKTPGYSSYKITKEDKVLYVLTSDQRIFRGHEDDAPLGEVVGIEDVCLLCAEVAPALSKLSPKIMEKFIPYFDIKDTNGVQAIEAIVNVLNGKGPQGEEAAGDQILSVLKGWEHGRDIADKLAKILGIQKQLRRDLGLMYGENNICTK
jgi:hypothetical protein